jgi:hypothetical protein
MRQISKTPAERWLTVLHPMTSVAGSASNGRVEIVDHPAVAVGPEENAHPSRVIAAPI